MRTLVVDFILERQSFSEDSSDVQSVGIKKLLADGVYRAAYPLHDVSLSTEIVLFYTYNLVLGNDMNDLMLQNLQGAQHMRVLAKPGIF